MSDSYPLQASQGYLVALYSSINNRRFESALAPLGLSRVNWCILLAAGQEGLTAPSDIAEFIGIDRTATSRGLRRLEADGLVHRESGTKDRRKTTVRLTEEGSTRLVQANAAASENAEHFTSKLTTEELEKFIATLKKLMAGEPRSVTGL